MVFNSSDDENVAAEAEGRQFRMPDPYRPDNDDPFVIAAWFGSLAGLQRLVAEGIPEKNIPPYTVPPEPPQNMPYLEKGKINAQRQMFSDACVAAAAGNDTETLGWLLDFGCPATTEICAKAASAGHLGALQFARARGCPRSELTTSSAAESGHTPCLQWLHENGCPRDGRTLKYAAERGMFQRVKYACDAGAPMDAQSDGAPCAQAAKHGHIKILKYLRHAKCDWDWLTPVYAAQKGRTTTLAWIKAQPNAPTYKEEDLNVHWNCYHPEDM
jgi:hypothetical protein|tara:strand:- start:3322 stop:4137 length:816 start_codon:yes stop_codon:yes gene_type:complete